MVQSVTLPDRLNSLTRKARRYIRSNIINDATPGSGFQTIADLPSMRILDELNARYPIASLLPYESYDPATDIYYNRDTAGFMVYASPASAIDEEGLSALEGIFTQEHKPDTSIQISLLSDTNIEPILDLWRETKQHAANEKLKGIFEKLSNQRAEYLTSAKWDSLFKDQSFLLKNLHLIISYTVPVFPSAGAVELSDDEIGDLTRKREGLIGTLESAYMHGTTLPPDMFINVMNGLLNPSSKRQPILEYDEDNLIAKQMVSAETAVIFGSGASTIFQEEEEYSLIPFHVRQFPKKWPGYNNGALIGSFTSNVLRMPCPFIATLSVNIPDETAATNKSTTRSLRAVQMSESPVSKFVPTWKERRADWEYTKTRVEGKRNALIEAFYQIVIITPAGREEMCSQKLKDIYGAIGWVITRSRYIPKHSLLGALPMGLTQDIKKGLLAFKHYDSRLSETCVNTAPWIGEWKGSETPIMLFMGRRGQVTFHDVFDNNAGNYNVACCATSGSGKSFLTQEWATSSLAAGGRVFIIDAGHSYRNICSIFNGEYLDFEDAGRQIVLNPFTPLKSDDEKLWKDQFPMLKMLIARMASPHVDLTSEEDSYIERAIYDSWVELGHKTTIRDVADRLDDQLEVVPKKLATMLHPFSKGMYSQYFDGEANINLDNDFVVLELNALNRMPDLQSIVLRILMMKITAAMYFTDRGRRKECIIDEAWRFLGSGSDGEFVEEGYRVARKYYGSFKTITQKISDYHKSEAAKAAFMNADFAFYLRQKPAELKQAEANGYIDNSDGIVDVLRGLKTVQGKYSEIAIDSPQGLAVVRLVVDPVTEKLYSTQPKEVQYIQDRQKEGADIFDAVNELVEAEAHR